jgi:hypothetical protein
LPVDLLQPAGALWAGAWRPAAPPGCGGHFLGTAPFDPQWPQFENSSGLI